MLVVEILWSSSERYEALRRRIGILAKAFTDGQHENVFYGLKLAGRHLRLLYKVPGAREWQNDIRLGEELNTITVEGSDI